VLSQQKANADFFEAAARGLDKKVAKQLCNLYMSDVMALLNESGKAIGECALTPDALRALVAMAAKGTINGPTLKELLPEKPEARRARMIEEYGIAEYDAGVLSQAKANADFFEAAAKGLDKKVAKQLCNLYMSDVMALLNESGKSIGECALTPESLSSLVRLSAEGKINGPTLKELLPELFEKGGDPVKIVEERGLGAVSDTSALEAFVDQAIAANPKSVADFKAGKKAAAGFIVGQVMKLSKGKADPKLVGPMVAKRLSEV
jgi:aspartyl-tRNA(Asn)/glutamyl-tRNA(Gln) amidotransferase subunit B